jgi:hypothetical protein
MREPVRSKRLYRDVCRFVHSGMAQHKWYCQQQAVEVFMLRQYFRLLQIKLCDTQSHLSFSGVS